MTVTSWRPADLGRLVARERGRGRPSCAAAPDAPSAGGRGIDDDRADAGDVHADRGGRIVGTLASVGERGAGRLGLPADGSENENDGPSIASAPAFVTASITGPTFATFVSRAPDELLALKRAFFLRVAALEGDSRCRELGARDTLRGERREDTAGARVALRRAAWRVRRTSARRPTAWRRRARRARPRSVDRQRRLVGGLRRGRREQEGERGAGRGHG